MAVLMITGHEAGDDRAKILAWHKRVGDFVEQGDELFTYALPSGNYLAVSEQTGRLAAIYLPAGESAAVPVDVALLSAADAKSALAFMPQLPKPDAAQAEADDGRPPWEDAPPAEEPAPAPEEEPAEDFDRETPAEPESPAVDEPLEPPAEGFAEESPWEPEPAAEDLAGDTPAVPDAPTEEFNEEVPMAPEAPAESFEEETPVEAEPATEEVPAQPEAPAEDLTVDMPAEEAPTEPETAQEDAQPAPAAQAAQSQPALPPVAAPLYLERFDATAFCTLLESLRIGARLCGWPEISARALLTYACIQTDAKALGLEEWQGLSLPEVEEYVQADMPGAQAVLTSALYLAAPMRPDGPTLCMGRAEGQATLCLTGCNLETAERFLPRLRAFLESIGTSIK